MSATSTFQINGETVIVTTSTWKRTAVKIVAVKGDDPVAFAKKVANTELNFYRFIDGTTPRPTSKVAIDPEHDRSRPSCIIPQGNESDCVRILSSDTTHTHPYGHKG